LENKISGESYLFKKKLLNKIFRPENLLYKFETMRILSKMFFKRTEVSYVYHILYYTKLCKVKKMREKIFEKR